MKHIFLPAAAAALLAVAGCENPADNTTDAKVEEAKPKPAPEVVDGTRYVFTDNSKIGFVGSKVTGSHEGGFKEFTGHFTIADGKPVGTDHKVEINLRSTWADNPRLARHLKGPDFFDVPRHPMAVFDVTSIEKIDTGYSVTGNLTLHGVTKSITFPATVSQNGKVAKIKAEFDINRFDWGIAYPGKSDDLIRKEVVLKLDLEARAE
ncbi:MAG: YceI family protein [Akkermansiaceae bacterium]|nr:YceI family protein [Akkermansiaceae bacterium]NNM29017.1 YceI family protein [Akkermansiaceae bacterium]